VEAVPYEQPDPCTGELVQGTIEVRRHAVFNQRTAHLTVHSKYRFSGNGLDPETRVQTPTQYRGSAEQHEGTNTNVGQLKFETSFGWNMRIFATNALTSESVDDFTMHINSHVTVFLPPDEFRLTGQVTNVRFDCK
jgi:hypothetical protein